MELFAYSVDVTRIVFLIGAVLSLIYKKRTGVTPGGIIVPGFLAITLDLSFVAFLVSIALAFVCKYMYKALFGTFALSTRLSIIAHVALSVLLSLLTTSILHSHHWANQDFILFSLIIPGLMAFNARKYGMAKVLYSALAVTAAAYCIGWLLVLLAPQSAMTLLTVKLATYRQLELSHAYITIAVSLLAALLIYLKFKMRAGGYLIAPFMAAIAWSSPVQFMLMLAGVAVSYWAVWFIQKRTLIIGLDRFIVCLFCGYFVVTAIDLIAAFAGIPGYRPSPLVLIVAMAVITNDLSLHPLKASLVKGVAPSLAVSLITRMVV